MVGVLRFDTQIKQNKQTKKTSWCFRNSSAGCSLSETHPVISFKEGLRELAPSQGWARVWLHVDWSQADLHSLINLVLPKAIFLFPLVVFCALSYSTHRLLWTREESEQNVWQS